jgi:hypothetical protein
MSHEHVLRRRIGVLPRSRTQYATPGASSPGFPYVFVEGGVPL